MDENKLRTLEWYTGNVPREIRFLKQIGDFVTFERRRMEEFQARARDLYKNSDEYDRREYNEFLRKVLVPRYEGHAETMFNVGSFYDKGLFYRSPVGFECISGPAKNALTSLLSAAMQQNLPPINSVQVCL